jgi:branched-chain amino acid transport system ATP-binding protein
LLKINEIDVYYGDLQALREASIEVNPGEVVSVIGSNGAGKSTLLRSISGILRPRRGTIVFNEKDISKAPTSRIVEHGISHVPEGRQIFPTMTVLENLEMGAQFPRTKKVKDETLEQVFTYFPRLKERRDQKAGTLSDSCRCLNSSCWMSPLWDWPRYWLARFSKSLKKSINRALLFF